jgi:hypothetical protein
MLKSISELFYISKGEFEENRSIWKLLQEDVCLRKCTMYNVQYFFSCSQGYILENWYTRRENLCLVNTRVCGKEELGFPWSWLYP